ncbi:MAG: hypothetical protein WAM92_15935 [Mycobacterium sp.]
MQTGARRWAGALAVSAGLAVVGYPATTATAHADIVAGPMREYWCPAEYFVPCEVWRSEIFQAPVLQSPLWQTPLVRVPWQSDGYD